MSEHAEAVGSGSAGGDGSDSDSVGSAGETARQSVTASGGPSSVLVFTSSVEATHRLSRLLQLLGLPAAEYSSAVPAAHRHATLGALRAGRAGIVVASDAMARGIDADTISTVINYDAPTNIRAYLHRVGRTARAGRKGACRAPSCYDLKPCRAPSCWDLKPCRAPSCYDLKRFRAPSCSDLKPC
jgi:superfamily II DNA helicase RecQ